MVLEKFGTPAWEDILDGAGMPRETAWVSYEYYPDGVTVELVLSAAKKLGAGADDVLQIFGGYFVKYLKVSQPSSQPHSRLARWVGLLCRGALAGLGSQALAHTTLSHQQRMDTSRRSGACAHVNIGPVAGLLSEARSAPQDNQLDKLIHIMGDNLKDFLWNLDYLHAHLQVPPHPTIPPYTSAPAAFCHLNPTLQRG